MTAKRPPRKPAKKSRPASATEEPVTARRKASPKAASAAKKAAPKRAPAKKSPGPAARRVAKSAPRSRAARPSNGDSEQFEDVDTMDDELDQLGIGSRMVPVDLTFEEEPPASAPPSAPDAELDRDVGAQIRALEARMDGLIKTTVAASKPRAPAPPSPAGDDAKASASDDGELVAELLSSDFYARQWGRAGMRERVEDVDDFGLDPAYERRLLPLFDFLFQRYFRTEVQGIDSVPSEGRCLLVANHSGTLPLDGLMLRAAFRNAQHSRQLRWLTEDFVYYLPFAGSFASRVGAVRACQENAERLLEQETLVAVFPEGVKGIGKRFQDRYRLQRFGRGGFIRLALRTNTPIVPCAIIGAEETNPLLHRLEVFSKALGVPYVPVTATFPWLGLMGLLPAPTKWRMVFGAPLHLDTYGPEAEHDHMLVGRLAERVRQSIQELLDQGVAARKSVWFG